MLEKEKKESLFKRIFRQPASATVLPEENLTTEIIAYFLDAYPPFREAFMREIGIGDIDGEWIIETQKPLPRGPRQPGAAATPWAGRTPDITMSKGGIIRVLIEVKIDAGPTGATQTKDYREYLDTNIPPEVTSRLVALTRWTPDLEFANACHKTLRFDTIAELVESVDDLGNEYAARYLAHDWIRFLTSKRWIMKIEQKHIDAIRERESINRMVNELEESLWDAVNSATSDAVAKGVWQWKRKSRASAGAFPPGRALWAAQLTNGDPQTSADTDFVQAGCSLGLCGSGVDVSICGLVVLRGKHLDEFRTKHGNHLSAPYGDLIDAPPAWSGQEQILRLDNLAAHAEVVDGIRRSLSDALAAIA